MWLERQVPAPTKSASDDGLEHAAWEVQQYGQPSNMRRGPWARVLFHCRERPALSIHAPHKEAGARCAQGKRRAAWRCALSACRQSDQQAGRGVRHLGAGLLAEQLALAVDLPHVEGAVSVDRG